MLTPTSCSPINSLQSVLTGSSSLDKPQSDPSETGFTLVTHPRRRSEDQLSVRTEPASVRVTASGHLEDTSETRPLLSNRFSPLAELDNAQPVESRLSPSLHAAKLDRLQKEFEDLEDEHAERIKQTYKEALCVAVGTGLFASFALGSIGKGVGYGLGIGSPYFALKALAAEQGMNYKARAEGIVREMRQAREQLRNAH